MIQFTLDNIEVMNNPQLYDWLRLYSVLMY